MHRQLRLPASPRHLLRRAVLNTVLGSILRVYGALTLHLPDFLSISR